MKLLAVTPLGRNRDKSRLWIETRGSRSMGTTSPYSCIAPIRKAFSRYAAPITNCLMNALLKDELTRNHEYWHVTTHLAFDKIWRDRELRAMPVEESVYRFSTVARYLNGVALFDFNSPQFELAEEIEGEHWNFFKRWPFAIAIGVDPRRLPGEILAYPENRDRTDVASTGQSLQLPFLIEVIHVGPISSAAWTRCLRIWPDLAFEKMEL